MNHDFILKDESILSSEEVIEKFEKVQNIQITDRTGAC